MINSREIRRMNIKSFLIDVVFGVLPLLLKLLFDAWALSVCLHALSTICLLGYLAYVWASVCFALVCLNISLPFIAVVIA